MALISLTCFFGGPGISPVLAETETIPVKLLTANVGNADLMNCGQGYRFKLCLNVWEEPLRASIKDLNPDLVALQEVFDVKWCEQMPMETDKRKVCFKYADRDIKHQARRLLGPDYTIVCDARSHYECIGVKTSFASVVGCPTGEICRDTGSLTHGTPENCDTMPVIFGVDIELKEIIIRVVNGHPAASGEKCRSEQVRRMFEGYENVPPLALQNRPSIIMGDMNLDPFRELQDSPDIQVWNTYVGKGKPFYYLSGPAEKPGEPYPTAAGKTLDHVITNFAKGKCATMGEAEGTTRLDRVDSTLIVMEANDHKAISCDLTFTINVPEPDPFEEAYPEELLDHIWDNM